LVTGQSQKFYRIRQLSPIFVYAMAVREQIRFGGSNTLVNSFDSSDPLYSNPINPGGYDPAKATDHGDIAAYMEITNTVDSGALSIYGKVVIGPGGSVWLGRTDLLQHSVAFKFNPWDSPGWYKYDMKRDLPGR